MWAVVITALLVAICSVISYYLLPMYWLIFLGLSCVVPLPKFPKLGHAALGRVLRKQLHYEIHTHGNVLEAGGQYIFATAPHGILSFAEMLTFVLPDLQEDYFPRAVVPLVASQLLWIPLLGVFARLAGCQNVGHSNFVRNIKNGNSVALAPGGTKEMALSQDSKLRILQREGFLRLAHAEGVKVVPLLSVGELSAHTVMRSNRKLQQRSYELLFYPLPLLFYGAWGTIWPRDNGKLDIYVGRAVDPSGKTLENFITEYYTVLAHLGPEITLLDEKTKIDEFE